MVVITLRVRVSLVITGPGPPSMGDRHRSSRSHFELRRWPEWPKTSPELNARSIKGVCNKGSFKRQGSMDSTELQTSLVKTSFGKHSLRGRL